MTKRAKIRVITTFEIDVDAWCDEYDVEAGDLAGDLAAYWWHANGAALIPGGPRVAIPDPPTTWVQVSSNGPCGPFEDLPKRKEWS